MKRILALFLGILFLISALPISVSAETTDEFYDIMFDGTGAGLDPEPTGFLWISIINKGNIDSPKIDITLEKGEAVIIDELYSEYGATDYIPKGMFKDNGDFVDLYSNRLYVKVKLRDDVPTGMYYDKLIVTDTLTGETDTFDLTIWMERLVQITLTADDAYKAFGCADPEFTYKMDVNLIHGPKGYVPEIDCDVVREPGEEPGEYKISIQNVVLLNDIRDEYNTVRIKTEDAKLTIGEMPKIQNYDAFERVENLYLREPARFNADENSEYDMLSLDMVNWTKELTIEEEGKYTIYLRNSVTGKIAYTEVSFIIRLYPLPEPDEDEPIEEIPEMCVITLKDEYGKVVKQGTYVKGSKFALPDDYLIPDNAILTGWENGKPIEFDITDNEITESVIWLVPVFDYYIPEGLLDYDIPETYFTKEDINGMKDVLKEIERFYKSDTFSELDEDEQKEITDRIHELNSIISDVTRIYSDVPTDAWYTDAALYCFTQGIISGVGDNKFAPGAELSRAMLVRILWNIEGCPKPTENHFTDIGTDRWYTDAVNWAAGNGIVAGMDNEHFCPDASITREQLAAIMQRYSVYLGNDVSARADLNNYADADKISDWAHESLEWAVSVGIISGRSETTLAPKGTATRAETASIMMRFIELTA